jgi:recombination protein RecT
MTQQNTAVTTRPSGALTLKQLVETPAYGQRFKEILKERAPQFVASLIQVWNGTPALQKCEPNSIIAAAMTAATLDLPIEKNLGFAHIVPYSGKASFQMGWKGFVQLAQRTGQYKNMNVKPVNEEAFGGYDEVGEPIILWDKVDETKPEIGYAFAFRTVGGFIKTVYWTKEKAMAHAQKYSQSFRSGSPDSLWRTNPVAMGCKTVVKDGLSKWGIMSVQLQRAFSEDQSVKTGLDAKPEYPDNMAPKKGHIMEEDNVPMDAEVVTDPPPAQTATTTEPQNGDAKPRRGRPPGAKNKTNGTSDQSLPETTPEPTPTETGAETEPEPESKPQVVAGPAPRELPKDASPAEILAAKLEDNGIADDKFVEWCIASFRLPKVQKSEEYWELSPGRMFRIIKEFDALLPKLKAGTPA